MHDCNNIIGVIGLRNEKISYPIIRQRHGIGHSGIDLIMNRYNASGLSWEELLRLEPSEVEKLIYKLYSNHITILDPLVQNVS